jgi:preprotein translocase subunit SecA
MMAAKAANFGPDLMRYLEKSLLLQTLDAVWKEHLLALDHLRQGIGLRAYGQRDPLNEYKTEAFALFNAMLDDLKERVTAMLARVELSPEAPPAPNFQPAPRATFEGRGDGGDVALAEVEPVQVTVAARPAAVDPQDPATWRNTPRNAACPCGSGKKYKHCHGRTV